MGNQIGGTNIVNSKKKLIELFIYITIVAIGTILLLTSNAREKNKTGLLDLGGAPHAIVLDE